MAVSMQPSATSAMTMKHDHLVQYAIHKQIGVQAVAQQGPQLASLMENIIDDRATVALMAAAHLTRLDALFAAPRHAACCLQACTAGECCWAGLPWSGCLHAGNGIACCDALGMYWSKHAISVILLVDICCKLTWR